MMACLANSNGADRNETTPRLTVAVNSARFTRMTGGLANVSVDCLGLESGFPLQVHVDHSNYLVGRPLLAQRIVAWRVGIFMRTDFVFDAFEQTQCGRQSKVMSIASSAETLNLVDYF